MYTGQPLSRQMSKRQSRSERKYIDENKVRVKREARAKLAEFLAYGTEQDFVAAIKDWKKDITPAELKELISLFHASVREKRGLDPSEH